MSTRQTNSISIPSDQRTHGYQSIFELIPTFAVPLTLPCTAIDTSSPFSMIAEFTVSLTNRQIRSSNASRNSNHWLKMRLTPRSSSDQGHEYGGEDDDPAKLYQDSNEFTQFLKQRGIVHLQSAARSSTSSGLAKCFNHTLQGCFWPLLLSVNGSGALWNYAVIMAAYIGNHLPSNSLPTSHSPHEQWFGKAPSVDHHPFGCVAVAKTVETREDEKTLPRSRKVVTQGGPFRISWNYHLHSLGY